MSVPLQKTLTMDRLMEVLEYEAETGLLIWKPSRGRGRSRVAGRVAGTFNKGYRRLLIDGRRYYTHNLIWFIETGQWPEAENDHKNRDRSNSRFSNLRLASPAQNVTNRKVHSNNLIGIKGVSLFRDGRWRARIQVSGKPIFLGYFPTKEDAAAAYAEAAKNLHGEFASPTRHTPPASN